MTLDGTKIKIDYRSEIDLMQEMIECYLKYKNADVNESTQAMLKKLHNRLDGLYMSW